MRNQQKQNHKAKREEDTQLINGLGFTDEILQKQFNFQKQMVYNPLTYNYEFQSNLKINSQNFKPTSSKNQKSKNKNPLQNSKFIQLQSQNSNQHEEVKQQNISLKMSIDDIQVNDIAQEIVQAQDQKEYKKKKKQKKQKKGYLENIANNPEREKSIENPMIQQDQNKQNSNNQQNIQNLGQESKQKGQKDANQRDNYDIEKNQFKYSEWDYPLDLQNINKQQSSQQNQPKNTEKRKKKKAQVDKSEQPKQLNKDRTQNQLDTNQNQQSIISGQIIPQIEEQKVLSAVKSEIIKTNTKKKTVFEELEEQKGNKTKAIVNQVQPQSMIQQESEFLESFKSIPKSKRERLTKKQLQRIDKPDLLTESLSVQVIDDKQKGKKVQIVQEAALSNEQNLKPNKNAFNNQLQSNKETSSFVSKLDSIEEEGKIKKSYIQQASRQNQIQKDNNPQITNYKWKQGYEVNQYNNQNLLGRDRTKQKPKKIVVEERNEFNEIVRQIIEKSKKRKVTALKKAIMRKREIKAAKMQNQINNKEDRKQKLKSKQEKNENDDLDSGYVTIEEKYELDENSVENEINKIQSDTANVYKTRKFDYKLVFYDLEDICEEVQSNFMKRYQHSSMEQNKELKLKIRKNPQTNEQFYQLHPKKSVREYVDIIQSNSLDLQIQNLISKLKKLYFNRKQNPNKKGKMTRQVKKRYIVGIKEIVKHLWAENLKMVIVAINLEKVDGDNGLDDFVYQIIQKSRELKVPLVFAMSRYNLGRVTKFQGQKASAVGIFNFQGANDEFNSLVTLTKNQRNEFYRQLARNLQEDEAQLLRKENRFLDWQYFDQVRSERSTFYI